MGLSSVALVAVVSAVSVTVGVNLGSAPATPAAHATSIEQTADEKFVAWARTNTTIVDGVADEEIIALGATICETYAAGVSKSTMLDFIRDTYDTTRRQLDAAKLMGGAFQRIAPNSQTSNDPKA